MDRRELRAGRIWLAACLVLAVASIYSGGFLGWFLAFLFLGQVVLEASAQRRGETLLGARLFPWRRR